MKGISIIAAHAASDRGIGKNNKLLWSISEDLKRFKDLTKGHPVIMGRKTWESLPEDVRPLPGRTNIVVTRNPDWAAHRCFRAGSLQEAIDMAKRATGGDQIFIIGGGEIFKEALRIADKLYLTVVYGTFEADAFFPPYDQEFRPIHVSDRKQTPEGVKFEFVDLIRR